MSQTHSTHTVVDLFSGVGGFSLGFILARKDGNNPFDVKLLIDCDTDAQYTFRKNYPEISFSPNDISRISLDTIIKTAGGKRPDIVIGGPPCQGFSSAGKRTEEDERNRLLTTFSRLAIELRPKVILVENVVNVLKTSHFTKFLKSFENTGYVSQDFIIDAANYGVPQHRKRLFVLAVRQQIANKIKKLQPPPVLASPYITVDEAIGDLPTLKPGENREIHFYRQAASTNFQKKMRKGSIYIFNHSARKHTEEFLKKISIIPEGGSNRTLPDNLRFSDNYFSQAYARLDRAKPANTITTHFQNPGSGRFTHYSDTRAITVREAARIQSFPDAFIFHGTASAQARHVGNAVPPMLSRAWAEHISNILAIATSKQKELVTVED